MEEANIAMESIKGRFEAAIRANQSVGIDVPDMKQYDGLIEALFHSMGSNTHDVWTFVAVSKTFDYLAKTYKEIDQINNIKFIDCISRTAGISTIHNNCIFIESPVMLERLILEILNNFKGIKNEVDKYVVIDSLSALMIYNEPNIIREFISVLLNRCRSENIHVISIFLKDEIYEMDSHKLIQLNDKIVVLRDSLY